MILPKHYYGERLFDSRRKSSQQLLGLKDVISLAQKTFAKRTLMPPIGEGEAHDGGLLSRLNEELNLKINPAVFSVFGLSSSSDSRLVEVNDNNHKSCPLIFLFNNNGSSSTTSIYDADTTFTINREIGGEQNLIAKSIRVGGVVQDETGKKRTVGIRYELPHPNWKSELTPGTALTIDFSVSRKEAELLKVEQGILQKGSPMTDLENPHNTAGLITKKMITDAGRPEYFVRLSINRLAGKFVLDGNLSPDLKISNEKGILVITLLNKVILKIPENALIK